MKILIIGAHLDDNEFRCGGVTYKYLKLNHEVRYLSVCNGSGGHHIMTPEETAKRRANEAANVAAYLGIKYDIWDNDDCSITADLELRRRLIRYIRAYSPDLIITHRTNDYHADHRVVAQLVQDASYMLIVPHECPEVPAMSRMPVIMFNVDRFKNPAFEADVIVDIDDAIDAKLACAGFHESQVYEWLPYTKGELVPEDTHERLEWLKGMDITEDTTDEEIMAATRGYAVQSAQVAVRFRKELIDKYGSEKGSKVRFAEAFMLSEYGTQMTVESKKVLFPF